MIFRNYYAATTTPAGRSPHIAGRLLARILFALPLTLLLGAALVLAGCATAPEESRSQASRSDAPSTDASPAGQDEAAPPDPVPPDPGESASRAEAPARAEGPSRAEGSSRVEAPSPAEAPSRAQPTSPAEAQSDGDGGDHSGEQAASRSDAEQTDDTDPIARSKRIDAADPQDPEQQAEPGGRASSGGRASAGGSGRSADTGDTAARSMAGGDLLAVRSLPQDRPARTKMDPAAVMPPQPEGPDSHFRRRRDEVVSALLAQMSLEEKVGQLIVSAVGDVAGPAVRDRSGALSEFLDTVRPGGLLFFTENIHTPEQVRGFIRDLQADRRIPLFVAVDEEGGVVSRLTRDPQMPATSIPSARRVGQSGDTELAYQLARVIGRELRALGFNMNFAPVADVLTNPENQVIGSRAYGSDVDTVSRFVSATVRGLEDTGMCAVLKHYPGHGDTAGDTHNTPVVIGHDLERLERIELVPFRAGIDAGAPAVMTGHIALPEVTGSEAAATFSGRLVDELLRGSIGFKGLVISDALTMGAVTARYSPEEAALRALEAGVDVLLRPVSPGEVHTALIEAVHNGRLSMERIDRSVSRILQTKIDYSILVPDDAVFHARASERPAPEPEVVGSSQHQSIVQRVLNEIRAGGAQ